MANIDEAFAALSDVQSVSVNENVDFVVDSNLRVISIPVRGVVLGVEGDKDVNRVTFRMSRTYKGIDMSQFQIRINYANANNELNYFKVTEITVSDDEIVFVWVVGADAVAYVGNVEFVVRFIKLSGSNIIQELNTTLATAKSLIGLSVDGEISPVQREDLLAHFYSEIDAYSETKKNEILDSIPEDYTALANEVDELKGDIDDHVKESHKAIEDLNDKKITKFYANSLGETTLNDSDNGKIQDMMMYGKSEQKSYSGKNLFNAKNEGIITVTDDGLLLNGTTDFHQFINLTIPAGSYFIGEMNGDSSIHSYIDNFDSYMKEVGAITFETDKMLSFYIAQGTYSNMLIKPYIVEGSNPMETYEPYVGGIPSPNPDYPQEIQSVVNPKLTVCGKNLCNYEYFKPYLSYNGVTCTVGKDEIGDYFLLNGTSTNRFEFWVQNRNFNLKEGVTRTISIREPMGSNFYLACGNLNIDFREAKSFTTSNEIVYFYIHVNSDVTIDNYKIYIQIENGSTATDYEPYKEQIASLPYTLNAIPVSSGGNVTIDGQEYIADYVDIENKKLVRNVRKTALTSLSYLPSTVQGTNGEYHYDIGYAMSDKLKTLLGIMNSAYLYLMCENTRIVPQPSELAYNENLISAFGHADAFEIRLRPLVNDYPTLEELNAYLTSTVVIYPIEPTITDLTDEEVQAFKDLMTYYSTTNVIVTSDQLDGYTTFNYPLSMENGWNLIKEQLGDTREYIYDMELQSAEAYVNSEYAVTLTELGV